MARSSNSIKKIHGLQPSMQLDPESERNVKLLRLKIYSGYNLAKKDIFGASDPYVRIDLINKDHTVIDSVYTKTKKKTLNPNWNEEFIFRVLPSSHRLLLEVFDENRLTRDDFLGKVELLLNNIPTESEGNTIIPRRYVLKQRSQKSKVRGDLEIYYAFIDSTNIHSLESRLNYRSIDDESDSEWEIIGGHNPHANSSNEDLPSGWEECQDTNGRTYFINHNSRTTHWERPSNHKRDNAILDQENPQNSETSSTFSSITSTLHEEQQRHYEQTFCRRFHIDNDFDQSSFNNSNYVDDHQSPTERPSLWDISESSTISNHPISRSSSLSSTSDQASSNNSHHHNHFHFHNHNHIEGSSSNQSQQRNDSITQSSPNSSNALVHTSETLGPLPNGWNQQVSETGRIFFIDHNNKTTTWIDPRTNKPSPSPQVIPNSNQYGKHSAVDDLGPLPPGWEERIHRDGRIFFINHNTRTTQWEDPRIDIPSISGPPVLFSCAYKKKYELLQNSLTRSNGPNKFEIKVKRNNILEDSFKIINNVPRVDYLKAKLWIEFENEDVLDYGGPSREWFYLLSKEMFNPYYGLFEYSSTDKYTLQIKPFSGLCNEMHLTYFKFIGRVAGMAIYHGKLLDAFFIRPFYKMMLEKEITLKDMESVDTQYYNSLKYILENDPSELDLNFMIDEKILDVVEEKELKPNGAQIPVTNENKHEYINLVIDWRFVSRVKPQMDSFLEGFHEIIPKQLIKIFDENELELLMCGIGNVDVKDWKHNTVYKGGYHLNHIVIQWFWRVVLSFNNEMRSRLLQFVTGTSRVPMNGFKELYGSNGPQLFTIEKWGNLQNLPRSHTCFNRLDLPCYESYSDLRDKLIKAIEGSGTYGGVD